MHVQLNVAIAILASAFVKLLRNLCQFGFLAQEGLCVNKRYESFCKKRYEKLVEMEKLVESADALQGPKPNNRTANNTFSL